MRMRRLICAFVVCMQQSRVSRNKVHTEYANLSINLAIKQDAFSNIFVLSQSKQLLRCSLVYHTQPPRGAISFLT